MFKLLSFPTTCTYIALLSGCQSPVPPKITASHDPRPAEKTTFKPPLKTTTEGTGVTRISVRNVQFIEPKLKMEVPWLNGKLVRTSADTFPNMDDARTYQVAIENGIVSVQLADLAKVLNEEAFKKSPISDVKLSQKERQLQFNGRLHKGASFPFEALTTLSLTDDNRIRIHMDKMRLLKIPVKGLLGVFHVDAQDMIGKQGIPGVEVKGNDVLVNQEKFLPPPRKLGKLSGIRIERGRMIYSYGNAAAPAAATSETWRNFLQLKGGMLSFGKLVMHDADITMIDVRNDPWFVLDMKRYQQQMALGYTRMTPNAGLRIFMPDINQLPSEPIAPPSPVSSIENRKQAFKRTKR